jgi:hypothetical protein
MEAKGKTPEQVAPQNDSCVNRLRNLVPRLRFDFQKKQLGVFDWRMLTSTSRIPNNEITQQIIDTYRKRSSRMILHFDKEAEVDNLRFMCQQLREELLGIYPDMKFIVDVIVRQIFHRAKTPRKAIFWACFGNEVLANLQKHIGPNDKMCIHCGRRFYRESPAQIMCEACSKRQRREKEALRNRLARAKKRSLEKSE